MEKMLEDLLQRITFSPSDRDFDSSMLSIDVEAMQSSLSQLYRILDGDSYDTRFLTTNLEVATKFLGRILDELQTKGTALLINQKYIKERQKQSRPARKLRIPHE